MFIYRKDIPLQDLGDGVSRRVLAHDGTMMAVEVYLRRRCRRPDAQSRA